MEPLRLWASPSRCFSGTCSAAPKVQQTQCGFSGCEKLFFGVRNSRCTRRPRRPRLGGRTPARRQLASRDAGLRNILHRKQLRASRRGRRPVCPAERSSASELSAISGVALNQKQTGIMTTCHFEAAVSRQAAAGLASGRPDEGVWAYVCIANCGRRKRVFRS